MPALVVLVVDGQPSQELAWQDRSGHCEPSAFFGALLEISPKRHFKLVGRFAGTQQDGAARHIAAEQQALWAAQDLDAFHIKEVVDDACRDAHVDAVDEHSHRRVDGRNGTVDTQAADGEVGHASRGPDICQPDVRGPVAQAGQVV